MEHYMRRQNRLPSFSACAGIFLYLLLCSSCSQFFQINTPPHPQAPPLYGVAELLFIDGRYEEALAEFNKNYGNAALPAEDRQRALYGLACTKLFLAKTEDELKEGLKDLKKWEQEKGNAPFQEDHRLLLLALRQQSDVFIRKNSEQHRQASRKDRLIASQKKQLAQLSETIDRLQKQLEELEAIDMDFQEKRKTL